MDADERFALFTFKVKPCSNKQKHPWDTCPYCHPQENARRRDVRKYRYLAEACPDYKLHGICTLGNDCPFAHGVFEINLHPAKFRTQLCVEGARCRRKMCFFAHGEGQLRVPDYSYGYRTVAEAEYVKEQLLAQYGGALLPPAARSPPRGVAPGTPPQPSPARRFHADRGAEPLPGLHPGADPLGLGLSQPAGWHAERALLEELAAAEQLLRARQALALPPRGDGGPRISMRMRRELGLEAPGRARSNGGSPQRGHGGGRRHQPHAGHRGPPSPASPVPLAAYAQAHLDAAPLLQLQPHGFQQAAAGYGLAPAPPAPGSLEEMLRLVASAPLSDAGAASPALSELGLFPPDLASLRAGLLDSRSELDSEPASLLSSPDSAAAAFARRLQSDGLAALHPAAACPGQPLAPGLAALGLPSPGSDRTYNLFS